MPLPDTMPSPDQISATRREYALTALRRVYYSLFGALFFVGAGFFFKLAIEHIGREFNLAVGFILLIPGALLLAQMWRSRLIIEGDVIELHSAFRVHRVAWNEIEGLRTIENQYGRWTRIYYDKGAFNVSDSFTGNEVLNEWLKGLPDLDQRDADGIIKEVSDQGSSALSDENSSTKFDRAKWWTIGLSVLAGAVSIPVIWVGYAPVFRSALVVLLACPPVGIILFHRFPLRFTVFRRKPDPRADFGFLIFWPGIGVLWSYQTANDPVHLVDGFQLAYWTLLIFACFVAALSQTAWKSPLRAAVFFALALSGGMYSIGLANAANALPDKSAPRLYRALTTKMFEYHTSKGTTHHLNVTPWGPFGYPVDVEVPRRTYDTSRVGDPVCFGLHPGFLRAPWYTLVPCPTP